MGSCSSGGAMFCSFIVLIATILLSTILTGVSFSDVEFNTAAIMINSLTKKIEIGVIYLPGKYHLGPSGKFIDYPTSYQWITF